MYAEETEKPCDTQTTKQISAAATVKTSITTRMQKSSSYHQSKLYDKR